MTAVSVLVGTISSPRITEAAKTSIGFAGEKGVVAQNTKEKRSKC